MSIFDYARNKIREKYTVQLTLFDDDVSLKRLEILEKNEIFDIDWYEEKSKQGFVNAITCRFKAFWKAQTNNEKLLIGATIAVVCLALLWSLICIDDIPLNIIILKISQMFFGYFIVLCVVWLYRLMCKDFIKRKVFYIVWVTVLLLSIPHIPQLFGYKTTQIGDFYEAREYTEEYYVVFSREPQSNTNRKQYMLPAQIERRYTYEGTTDDGNEIYDLNYHINYLYFSNGGYLSFDYDDSDDSNVVLGKEMMVMDYHGDFYYVTLTDEKVRRG